MRRLALLASLFVAPPLWGHGAVHDQIRALEARIAREPERADLYLQRGRLYLEDRHFREAIGDFGQTLRLDPGLRAAHYFLADALLRSGDAAGAEKEVRAFLLALGPDDHGGLLRGHRLLGQVLLERKSPLAAAGAFRTALVHAAEPDPAVYREAAAAYRSAGPAHLATALAVLDEGTERMGPLPSLLEMAVDIELARGHTEGALRRLDRLVAAGPGRERWLARKGEILAAAGRQAEAREAYRAALAAIEALPPGRRRTRAVRRLEDQVRDGLNGGP